MFTGRGPPRTLNIKTIVGRKVLGNRPEGPTPAHHSQSHRKMHYFTGYTKDVLDVRKDLLSFRRHTSGLGSVRGPGVGPRIMERVGTGVTMFRRRMELGDSRKTCVRVTTTTTTSLKTRSTPSPRPVVCRYEFPTKGVRVRGFPVEKFSKIPLSKCTTNITCL